MNILSILDCISVIGFLSAFIIVLIYSHAHLDVHSRLFILLSLGIYILIGISNTLEFSGVTDSFDIYEDYIQVLFLPFFLFFNYSMMIKNEYDMRKKAEEGQREKEETYRTLIENINLGITLIDREHNIIMINSPHAKFFNREADYFIGKKCYYEFEKREHICVDCPGLVSMRSGRVSAIEKFGVRDDGNKFPVKIRTFPVYDKGNELFGFIEVVEDISEFKHMEDELIKRKKLESVGLLAGGIAHDFNNLLTAIMGNISLARMTLNPGNEVYGMLGEIENASVRARDLTHQLLTFSKGGAPIKKTTTISELIVDSVNFILHGSNIVVRFNIHEGLWPIDADEGQLSQVIYNLITNARQAMPGGGTILVTADNVQEVPEEISRLNKGGYVRITIEDTGTGIHPEHIHKIYDPFFTTKDDGSGLGLSTAYSIIKKHDGFIDVKSSPGSGTVFQIYFPVSDKVPRMHAVKRDELVGGRGRVIIMDDDETVRVITAGMLKHLGYEVLPAKDGAEAVKIYSEFFKMSEPVYAVILDLTVPGGVGGLKAFDELKKINPDIKAIVSSGYSNDPVMSDFRAYGFAGVAPKPYKIEDLGHILHDLAD